MLLSTVCAGHVFFEIWNEEPYIVQYSWFTIGGIDFTAGLYLNNMAVLMLFLVTLISFLVHVYSLGYMIGDMRLKTYFAMLGFFSFSMLGIVCSDNLLLMFVFWELVGFSSYMLIGHWQEKPEAAAASKKAFIFNRIGDAGFLIGLMILWANTNTFGIQELQALTVGEWQFPAAICIFCGVIGKSAQFPLLTWLPDAMEGPTPVSALIHAATMVAAGVFLLARIDFLFPPQAQDIIISIGILSALIGALAALVQTDIKKVLAYSTISQLGFMVTAFGAGSPDAAMFHLFTHAFFKACLFLSAGSIIHAVHQAKRQAHLVFNEQDIGNLGGLRKKLPFTFLAMIISGSALAGIPFLSGFLSKEAIFTVLHHWKGEAFSWRWMIFILAFIISFITVLYIFRLVTLVFLGEEKVTKDLSVMEPPIVMRGPVALLALGSLWFIASWDPFNFSGWLWHTSLQPSMPLTIFSILWVSAAVGVAFFLLKRNAWVNSKVLHNAFYLDTCYRLFIGKPVLTLASATNHFDKKWIDGFLHASAYIQVTTAHFFGWFDRAIIDGVVNFIVWIARTLGSFTRSFQSGKIQLYIFWTIFAIIIFLIWTLI